MVTTLARAWFGDQRSEPKTGFSLAWLPLLLLPLVVGCDGCRMTSPADEEARQLEQQQPPFTSIAAKAYPGNRADAGNGGFPDGSVKPGHWASVELTIRSNRDDRRGTVLTRAEVTKSETIFNDDALAPDEPDSAKSILVRRPAVLPKGQRRRLDTRLQVPDRGSRTVDAVRFDGDFLAGDASGALSLRPSQFAAMPPQTYFFVILTDRPERFVRLQTADWVSAFESDLSFAKSRDNYRIVIPPTQGILPIAETALDWTSTSVLLWDDVPTTALTPSQRTAVLDWLHFGGLIIVNGPAGVDSLTERTFRNLLPIRAEGVEELSNDAAMQLIRSQSILTDPSIDQVGAEIEQSVSQIAIAGQTLAPDAVAIGEGGLLVERRVGRGRIVQSRVDLMSDWFLKWRSYDSFFNSAILGRPPRVFRPIPKQELAVQQLPIPTYVDGQPVEGEDSLPLRQTFIGVEYDFADPTINTAVRWFSRDARMPAVLSDEQSDVIALSETEPGTGQSIENIEPDAAPERSENATDTETTVASIDPWLSSDTWPHPTSGLGGWKNDSPLVSWGRETLRNEIGLTIPDSGLVFRSLLVYLIVLIPVNYILFRMLGRLEWAWLAIVPLSILGALWVARAAQLDVGFARSRNEVAMLEIPKDYSRGHLTRVIGLYNSLASQYRVDFASPDAAIEMIRMGASAKDREANLFGTVDPELSFGFEAGPSLDNISVGSNAYGVVHTEQIIDVDGVIGLQTAAPESSEESADALTTDDAVVVNRSSLELLDTFVVERDIDGEVRIAPLGTLSSGSKKPIRWQPAAGVTVPGDLPMGMTDVIERLLGAGTLVPGSARLVARVDNPLSGLTISPDCKQVRSQTVVLVHLDYPSRPEVQTDKNLVTDFIRKIVRTKESNNPAPVTLPR